MITPPSDIADSVRRSEELLRQGLRPQALAAAQEAVVQAPQNPDALNALGLALIHADRFAEAREALSAALRLDRRHALAWCNLGNALSGQRRHADAAVALGMALDLVPEFADALNNRAYVWSHLKDYPRAIADFEALLRLRPGDPRAFAVLTIMRANICDWTTRAADLAQVAANITDDGPVVMEAFEALALYDDPALHARAAAAVARAAAHGVAPLPAPPPAEGKIRIGYISADLRDHVIAYIITEVIEAHDRDRFEVVAFSTGPHTGDAAQQRLQAAFDEFHVMPDMAPQALAEAIRERRIEIAVDLTGYTQWGRTAAFARRPAPVQVNFLGFPGTFGADYVDYILADPVVIPAGAEGFYAEAVARLPHAYHPNHTLPDAAPTTRVSNGLPEDAIVFCCFNNSYKITPQVFTAWMTILQATPGSVLWLLTSHAQVEVNLRREAAAQGVDPDRLIFAPRIDPAGHAARLILADMVLDTAPYGAHTTAFDALWAGVPVVTCAGDSFASRVAASLLAAARMTELNCASWADYAACAVALAGDPERLAALKARLAAARATAPLFDTVLFTRDLERAYETMAARSRSGLPPQAFDLAPCG